YEMDFGSNRKINYTYNGSGQKNRRSVSDGINPVSYTNYVGMFVHEYSGSNEKTLKYIMTPEGRILNTGTNSSPVWKWEYNLTDHLGNVRVVLTPGATAGYSTVLQETAFYPYGMRITSLSSTSGTDNDYLYNGKQLQTDFDLDWYDYGARFYDAELGRWHSPDPMAEVYDSYSPYAYVMNNPIKLIDPNGMWSETFTGAAAQDLFRYLKSTYGQQSSQDNSSKDEKETPQMLGEVTVKPKNKHGVHMLEFEKGGELYRFTETGNPLYSRDNTIENYLYYLEHQENFTDKDGNPIPFNKIFKSENQKRGDLTEDILLEIYDMLLLRGNKSVESGDVTDALRGNRRSKYANRFPSNKSEFAPTKEEERLKQLYQIEKQLSPAQRSPEFSIWEKKFSKE
uniref:RHS repeat domain-containing protein n=1 Tax=Mariniphaga sediminis TaxID=1628158 RepID=UPI003566E705